MSRRLFWTLMFVFVNFVIVKTLNYFSLTNFDSDVIMTAALFGFVGYWQGYMGAQEENEDLEEDEA